MANDRQHLIKYDTRALPILTTSITICSFYGFMEVGGNERLYYSILHDLKKINSEYIIQRDITSSRKMYIVSGISIILFNFCETTYIICKDKKLFLN